MVLEIADRDHRVVSTVTVTPAGEVSIEGSFPGGLTSADLRNLAYVYYEMDERGEIVTRLREVPPSETLDYVRAVLDALPPGYYIDRVESEAIERERRLKRKRFEEELTRLEEDEPGS